MTRFHPVTRLRSSEATPLFPLYAYMVLVWTELCFTFIPQLRKLKLEKLIVRKLECVEYVGGDKRRRYVLAAQDVLLAQPVYLHPLDFVWPINLMEMNA